MFAATGTLALIGLLVSFRSRRDGFPLAMTVLFFLSAFLALGAMFWPYIIPYRITVGNGAPDSSLSFLFYGAVVVLPLIIVSTIRVYWISAARFAKAITE